MKTLMLIIAAICATSAATSTVGAGEPQKVTYKLYSIYYNPAYSTTPNPKCECDLDNTKLECPESFQSSTDQGELCYDEYDVPSDWTYAQIFRRQ